MPIYITPYAFFMFPIVYYPSHPFRGCNFLGGECYQTGGKSFYALFSYLYKQPLT